MIVVIGNRELLRSSIHFASLMNLFLTSEASMQYHPDKVVTLGPGQGQDILHHPSGAVTQR